MASQKPLDDHFTFANGAEQDFITKVSPRFSPAEYHFARQPTASSLESRSAPGRRPPASRSSHGIATSAGPPPALITQHLYNTRAPPASPNVNHSPPAQCSSTDTGIDSAFNLAHDFSDTHSRTVTNNAIRVALSSSPANRMIQTAMETENNFEPPDEYDLDATIGINGQKSREGRHSRNGGFRQELHNTHEDLFLNLAKADSVVDDTTDPLSRTERRRVSQMSYLCLCSKSYALWLHFQTEELQAIRAYTFEALRRTSIDCFDDRLLMTGSSLSLDVEA